MFGPPVPVRPDVHGQIVVGMDKTEGDNKMPVEVPLKGEEFRRSVYIQVRRSRPLAMLHAFDAPVMEVNCERRQSSTVATQSLMLMNSQFILDQAARFARRLQTEAGDDRANQVTRAWQLAFSRTPTGIRTGRRSRFPLWAGRLLEATAAAEKKTDDEKAKKDEKKKPARNSRPNSRRSQTSARLYSAPTSSSTSTKGPPFPRSFGLNTHSAGRHGPDDGYN